jgi:hypothetical protein
VHLLPASRPEKLTGRQAFECRTKRGKRIHAGFKNEESSVAQFFFLHAENLITRVAILFIKLCTVACICILQRNIARCSYSQQASPSCLYRYPYRTGLLSSERCHVPSTLESVFEQCARILNVMCQIGKLRRTLYAECVQSLGDGHEK